MPTSFIPIAFKGINVSDADQLQAAWFQLCDFVSVALTPSGIANLLNGQGLLAGSALANGSITPVQLKTSLNDLGSPAGNSTVDTAQASHVFVRASWTTAANWTLTLNNLAQGALVYLRLVNNSGAARTFTVAANTPASVAFASVSLFAPANNVLSSGVSINSGAAINGFGGAYTTGSNPTLHMVGSIG